MTDPDITVLYVDDDEEFTELAREYIQRHHEDITIRTARTGDDALAHLESTDDIDCVVSDYEIPELNGLDLLDAVRERWPALPFIFFAGQGGEKVVVRAINAGVTDYLQKRTGTSQYELLANRIRTVVAKHHAEEELKRAAERTEAQFELLVDTVEDYVIFLLDEDGYIQSWNAGAVTFKGYTSEEIISEHFSIFYREEDVAAGVPDRNLSEAATEGHTRDEGWRVRKDGSEFWADVTITALREKDTLVGYTKVMRDSTQRRREKDLLERNEQLRDLIAAISHDLRNPLGIAAGNVQLAIETDDLSRLETTTRALSRMDELLDYLSTLAKENKQLMKPEPVDLCKVVEASWGVIETDGATLDVEGGETLMADRQGLKQLLENLLGNAVEHAGPDVTVSVGPLDGAGFYVEDDGPGIPEAERVEVFEMGYSGDVEGTGFGLAICKQIADVNGWFIKVTNGTDGGARFEVSDVGRA